MGNLTTLADQKTILQIDASDTLNDAYFNLLIGLVSTQIETYLDRKLGVADYVEDLPASNTQILQMRNWPINSVAFVTENNVTLTVNSDYFLYSQYILSGQIYRGTGWIGQPFSRGLTFDPYANQINLHISYNAGYQLPGTSGPAPALPLDISFVCQQIVAAAYNKQIAGNTGDVYKGVAEGGLKYQFNTPNEVDPSLFGVIGGLLPIYGAMLNAYRRWVVR